MRDVYAVLRQKEIEQSSLKNEVEALRIVARRSVMTEYKWHEVYKAALLETDWSKMEERITAAEAALQARKHEFDLNHGGEPEENQAIEDAL